MPKIKIFTYLAMWYKNIYRILREFFNLKTLSFHYKNIIEISRLRNPWPIFLLFLPCAWGLLLGYAPYISKFAMAKGLLIFFIGSVAGRSFGCIVNDIVDKDIDIKVERTKSRAIASGAVSVKYAISIAAIWLFVGLCCLLMLNYMAYLFVIAGVCISVIYPFTKRFFKTPQLVLGIAFNIGVLVGYSAIYKTISNSAFAFYIAGIYWTMFYDTIYATADLEDDKRLGINSTAVQHADNTSFFLLKCIIMMTGLLVTAGILDRMPWQYYTCFPIIFLELWHIVLIFYRKTKSPQYCLNRNVVIGFMIAAQILIGRCFHG